MDARTEKCRNCSAEFPIKPEDFEFYDKVKVPPPTWCPRCRLQRRMVWRNEHLLFRRKDDETGEEIFSMFPPAAKLVHWEVKRWWSDDWDQNASGMDIDWNRPFLEQFRELLGTSPLPSRAITDLVNSDYSNNATGLKNCYLVFASNFSEDSMYCENLVNCKACMDSSSINGSELMHDAFFCRKGYKVSSSAYCEDCHDVSFCYDCVGCSNCTGCVGLRNKSYCILNKQYSREEYEKAVADLRLDSWSGRQAFREKVKELRATLPVRYTRSRHNEASTGEYITNSKNVKDSYLVEGGENLKFCHSISTKTARDSYDHYRFGMNTELIYEAIGVGGQASRIFFCSYCWSNAQNLFYCFYCPKTNDCFGCVGLHGKRYCILNKQYSKEEYEELVPKLIQHMKDMPYTDSQGRVYGYGEFFPPEFSHFAYNETIAQEFFPLTPDKAQAQEFEWRPHEKKKYENALKPEALPDSINEVEDSICNEITECTNAQNEDALSCLGAFRITPAELQFYRTMKLPIPRFCSVCRYFQRLEEQAPAELWHRACQCAGGSSQDGRYKNQSTHSHGPEKCPNEFETSYSSERREIVYCEACYQSETV